MQFKTVKTCLWTKYNATKFCPVQRAKSSILYFTADYCPMLKITYKQIRTHGPQGITQQLKIMSSCRTLTLTKLINNQLFEITTNDDKNTICRK